MKRLIGFIGAVSIVVAMASAANAQVVTLMVGNQTSFNALDRYAFPSGAYQGSFAGPGTGPPGTAHFSYGPNGNVFLFRNTNPTPLLQYNGTTGNFVNTFVADNGGGFTFGPDGNLYRANSAATGILRYDGTTGAPLGTFVPSGLTFARKLQFGAGGDLFVADGNTITRVNGTSGAIIGPFIAPGTGGIASVFDFLFTPGGLLLVTASGIGGDRILQFDGVTGSFLGTFAQGNGLDVPLGMTLGPDSAVYVASTGGDSIKRFDSVTGAFLGDFAAVTAHPAPTYIQFAPFPIPEPASVIFVGAAAGAFSIARARKIRRVGSVTPK